jgi:glycolate oxidase iron-sulfur subunit
MTTETGAFDSHQPPSADLLADCVHCGFCLPACPTYALWQRETDSPRGRIHLMKVALEGKADITVDFARHFDTCLGCMACVTACPSGVQYDKLVEATRPQLERQIERTEDDHLFRQFIFSIFPYPKRLRWVALKLWLYQNTGLQQLVRNTSLLDLLPTRLRAMESMAPSIKLADTFSSMPNVVPAVAPKRKRVAMLLGCVQRVFFNNVNQATARVLAAEGCEVVIPQEQGCCGALMFHTGLENEAVAMARQFIDAFEAELSTVDAIVINAAGCGSTLKEYGYLLRNDPDYATRAQALADKCRDVSEVLSDLEPQATRHPLPLRIAYHDACHLQHAQQISSEPRKVLSSIPELEICEIPESELCCGSAGIYNLVESESAQELGARKAQHVTATGSNILVSSNPGCLLQMQASLERKGHTVQTMHLVELLDASIQGTLADQLENRPSA